jgi:hypothetical protein
MRGPEWGDPKFAIEIGGKATESSGSEYPDPVHDTVKAGKTSGVTYNKDGSVSGYNMGYPFNIPSSTGKSPDTIRWIQYDTP